MSLLIGRREWLRQTGAAIAGGTLAHKSHAVNASERALGDPLISGYGTRSQFATEVRRMESSAQWQQWTGASFTPLAETLGNITPSGLHFERHHAGIPTIDPAQHILFVHGAVKHPLKFSMEDLKRFPSITRKYFIECSGNSAFQWRGATHNAVQFTHGLLSTSEWTGVPFAMIAREVGLEDTGAWVLAEGADAALMTRSVPLGKLLSNGLLAYGQNGEALRPEQGFPLRLIVPGFEGNVHIKWLRRLEIADTPFMTREETSKYTDLMADGKAKSFTLTMDAKSVITSPSGGMRLSGPGPMIITGLAWSGRGNGLITGVDISFDGGHVWTPANLDTAPEPFSTVRFSFPWRWTGKPVIIQSRCRDETGYVQPTHEDLIAQRPSNGPYMSIYHYNGIQRWAINADGTVINAPL